MLCFHNAGNAEDMYTSEGTGARRVNSPLLVTYLSSHSQRMAVSRIDMVPRSRRGMSVATAARPRLSTK